MAQRKIKVADSGFSASAEAQEESYIRKEHQILTYANEDAVAKEAMACDQLN